MKSGSRRKQLEAARSVERCCDREAGNNEALKGELTAVGKRWTRELLRKLNFLSFFSLWEGERGQVLQRILVSVSD